MRSDFKHRFARKRLTQLEVRDNTVINTRTNYILVSAKMSIARRESLLAT